MTVRDTEYTGNPNRKYKTALCGELALEEFTDLPQDKVINELLITVVSKNIPGEWMSFERTQNLYLTSGLMAIIAE
jgi:hypothetical protein